MRRTKKSGTYKLPYNFFLRYISLYDRIFAFIMNNLLYLHKKFVELFWNNFLKLVPFFTSIFFNFTPRRSLLSRSKHIFYWISITTTQFSSGIDIAHLSACLIMLLSHVLTITHNSYHLSVIYIVAKKSRYWSWIIANTRKFSMFSPCLSYFYALRITRIILFNHFN